MSSTVLLVLINYRSSEYLARCLESVPVAELAEIVVLDNRSGPEEVQSLRAIVARYPNARLIENDVNTGFGAGVNRAVRSATSAWTRVWVLNPDTTVAPGCLQRLLQACEDDALDIVSPRILQVAPDGTRRVWFEGGRLLERRGSVTHDGIGGPAVPSSGVVPTAFVTGTAPLVTRAAWERLSGYREDLFLYGEDSDLSLRAREMGLRAGVVLDAEVYHLEGGSSASRRGAGKFTPTHCYWGQRNRIVVFAEHSSVLNLLVGAGLRETVGSVVKPLLAGRFAGAAASVRGLARGSIIALRSARIARERSSPLRP